MPPTLPLLPDPATGPAPDRADPVEVAVVGAGLAGLSAAWYLAQAGGCRVTLFERKSHLGGRTYAFANPNAKARAGDASLQAPAPAKGAATSQVWLDNSIHIAMGCCTALQQFLHAIGAGDAIEFLAAVPFSDAAGRRSVLNLDSPRNRLHPLGQLEGILRADFLSRSERLAAVGLFSSLARLTTAQRRHWRGRCFAEYARSLNLPAQLAPKLLAPLLVGALNTPYEACDFDLAVTFFVTGLLRSPKSGWIGLFRGDLQTGMIDPAAAALEQAGVAIRTLRSVQAVLAPAAGARIGLPLERRTPTVELQLTGGECWRGHAVLFAVPWFEPLLTPLLPGAGRLRPSQILCVHLGYDRPVLQDPCLGLLDSPLHWLFSRRLPPLDGCATPQLLSAVISCSDAHARTPANDLIALADGEIRRRLPGAAGATLVFARAVKNHPATFLSDPACTALRPPPGPIAGRPGLFCAGEWTATGWPSTMEGAVRSAIMALRPMFDGLGLNRAALPVIAELPRAGLMKFLLQP